MDDDGLYFGLRLVALICYVLMLAPVCWRILGSDSRDVLYARIATAVLLAYLTYTQLYASVVRWMEAAPEWGPLSVSLFSAIAGITCVWGFWPFRRGS